MTIPLETSLVLRHQMSGGDHPAGGRFGAGSRAVTAYDPSRIILRILLLTLNIPQTGPSLLSSGEKVAHFNS